jgi:cell fate (sporulation/competence/biofilm development) regulator YlbF (YheA/YmcA/DUF963 family)
MSDLNNNDSNFNLPAYLHSPLFLYQDNRLDRPALLIASFFYSLHTAGQKITASTDYLCQLANIKKRQLYNVMNQLEDYKYIKRTGFTNRKKLEWIYSPKSSITIIENETSALQCTSDQELNTSAIQCTKLVQSSALNYCTPVHTYNKEDIKDYKTTTTVPPDPNLSSSSLFSSKQTTELLDLKLSTDERSNELFLEHCTHHVETQANANSKYQRFTGLKNILIKLHDSGEHFKAKGFSKNLELVKSESKIPSEEDFENYKKCIDGFSWVGAWMQKQKKG